LEVRVEMELLPVHAHGVEGLKADELVLVVA
jgi:hypothetical protein